MVVRGFLDISGDREGCEDSAWRLRLRPFSSLLCFLDFFSRFVGVTDDIIAIFLQLLGRVKKVRAFGAWDEILAVVHVGRVTLISCTPAASMWPH